MSALRHFVGTLRGGRLAVTLLVLAGVLLLGARLAASAYVEILWQQSTGYSAVFWRRVAWSWGTRLTAGLLVVAIVYANLRLAAVSLGGIHIRRRFGNIEISEQLPASYVSAAILAAASLLGLWFGAAVPSNLGVQIAAMVGSSPWGVTEPILGRDVGYYVFELPVVASAVTFALVVMFLVFTLVTAAYATTGAVRWTRGRLDAQDLARAHLGGLVACFLLVLAFRIWLGRSLLLLDGTSGVQGIFGFADAQARLPALQTLVVILVVGAGTVFWGAWKDRGVPVVVSLVAVILGGTIITRLYPSVVQRFQVIPNELARETPYIEHNLRFTRLGFDLDDLERRRFAYAPEAGIPTARVLDGFSGLPVWSRNTLLQSFRAIEARFPYYDFSDVTIDRYDGTSGSSVVAVSVREIDPSGIQDPSWQNLHLRDLYVRGLGAAVSQAVSRSPEARPEMLISGIPPERTPSADELPELRLERPEAYFSSNPQPYALLDPVAHRGESPEGELDPLPADDVPGGIEMRGRLRAALLAWRFQDANLFFASDLTPETRFVHRRNVLERVRAVAPFLRFPEAPRAIIADGRITWLLEGFTGTRAFPLSTVHTLGTLRSQVSYVRSSVKVTVDAVTGSIGFYRIPNEDPLADAYDAAFPGLLRPIEEMPSTLRDHVHYPSALMDVQSRVLLQYHQETAADFHGQQDVWATAQQQAESTTPVRYTPEYGLYLFPGDLAPRFNLTTVFVPAGRQNLTGVLAGRTDATGVPELDLLDVAVADQVPGPRQIEALVEQDPIISQQFALWRSGGSEVWTGHLHLLPIDGRMFYMEPVFLAAESNAIPELRRFLVSDGRRIVMTEQLAEGVTLLAGGAGEIPSAVSEPGAVPTPGTDPLWPQEALNLLERADDRARAGDWEGYGAALAELRAFLEGLRDADGSGAAVDRPPGAW